MALSRSDLGRISLSVSYTHSRRQLVDRITRLVDDLPPGDEALGRIVLIMPDTLRRLLEWPDGKPPIPFLLEDALVFRRPESGLVIPKIPLS